MAKLAILSPFDQIKSFYFSLHPILRSVFCDDPFKATSFRGSFLTLFQRNLLEAFQNIDVELAEHVSKYCLRHALQWLSPKNVALSVHSKVPPYCIEAVKVSSFSATADTKALLKNRKTRLRDFFPSESQAAPCIFMPGINPTFRKA